VSTTELSAETRARILGTAWRLVTDRGAGAVTVKEVAAAAGVSRQLVYFHYQNRAGLLLAMARHQDRSSGFTREVAAARALDPVPAFETLLRAWCAYLARILPVARALEAAYVTGDEGGDAWRDRMAELREAFRLALGRIADEGRLAPGWAADTAADWAWSRVQPGTWAALVGMRGWDPGEYTERTAGSLLAELVAGAGADTRPVRDK
jgi:AcrR family transcriptional regulator